MATYHLQWEVGAHSGFNGTISDTLWTSINYGMTATQFFLGSPYDYERAVISENDIDECNKILDRFPMKVFSHFPYIANLAGSTKSLAWQTDPSQDRKTKFVLKNIEYELNILAKLNGGVVIHPGNFADKEKGLTAIAESINRINFPENSKLLLENAAGQGSSLATSFSQIKSIIDQVKDSSHIYVCIDTCHIFACGEYDLRKISEVDRMFKEFDQTIGLDRLKLIHLNDSEIPFGKKVDEHACLGTGYIWTDNFDSLVHLLEKCKQIKVPAVLETHGIDMITLSLLNKQR